jgi:hypothetical protein
VKRASVCPIRKKSLSIPHERECQRVMMEYRTMNVSE